MQQLINALRQLVSGFPKQATATIQMLMNSDPNFFTNLTTLIIQKIDKQWDPPIIRAAIATLNTLAMRCKAKADIKDFLTLQQIYNSIRAVLMDDGISFEDKKILAPSLTQFLSGACSTHKQILQLKQFLIKSNKSSVSIILDSIIKSKQIEKPIKIDSIIQLFDMALTQTMQNFDRIYQISKYPDKGVQKIYQNLFNRVNYFIDLVKTIFTAIFNEISQPYEYDALVVISGNVLLGEMLIYLSEWRHPHEKQLKYIWLQDVKNQNGDLIFQFCYINNLKQNIFKIISVILSKTDPDFNISQSKNKFMNKIDNLTTDVLSQLIYISNNFEDLNNDYFIGSLCDSMLDFISQSLRLNDIVQILAPHLQNDKLIQCLLVYLRLRDTDISSLDQEDFISFLEGFCGDINLNQISRYGVSKLVQMCCKKFDTFSLRMFQMCYNSMIYQLKIRQLGQNRENEDFYQHLFVNGMDNSSKGIIEKIQISCCLLGLIIMQHQIETRSDFRQAVSQFLIVLDINHFQHNQISIIYYLLSKNKYIFYQENLVDAAPRYINWAFYISLTYKQCSPICLQFVRQLYQAVVKLPIQHNLSQKFCNIIANKIWEMISIYCEVQKKFNCQHFYDILYDLVNAESIYLNSKNQNNINKVNNKQNKNGQKQDEQLFVNKNMVKNGKMSIKIERVGDFLLSKYGKLIDVVLQKSCEKQAYEGIKQDHDKLLVIKLHNVIVRCLQSLEWLQTIQFQTVQYRALQFSEYIKAPQQMIKFIMQQTEHQDYSGALSVEQALNLIQILSILITQQRKNNPFFKSSQSVIDCTIFQILLPIMLKHPFGQAWLICLCQFTHRINGKYKLHQMQQIMYMIKSGYQKYFNDQLKLNQLNLFSIVLLNYYQPQNWHHVHQLVRLNIIKLIKIDSRNDKIQRRKQMAQMGYKSQGIFGITIIRLFHVYLFGFRLQPSNQLLSELLSIYHKYVEKYCLVQTSHFIIGFQSSYKQINEDNFQKLLDILLQILNKLMLNDKFYGSQKAEQSQIRKLSYKIGCMSIDPYRQFKGFLQNLQNEGINLLKHPKHAETIKSMMNISTYMGQPRKFYSIAKKAHH